MNALHNLVAQGKVLYLVCCVSAFGRPYSHRMTGNLRYTSMDSVQGKSICEGPRKDPILDLSGKMEPTGTIL